MNTIADNNRQLITAFRLAGWSSLILLLYSLLTILIVVFIGGPPSTADECFSMLASNRVGGILRLDILTVFVMPLYYVLFYAVHADAGRRNLTLSSLCTIFIFAGVTLFLAAPSVFSYVRLSDEFSTAASAGAKQRILAAAEAVLATDIWNGTGPRVGGLMVQTGATILSVLMLRSSVFSRATAWTGIVTHGLDLLHMLAGFWAPGAANAIMAVAGVLYLPWFILIARDFFKANVSQQ